MEPVSVIEVLDGPGSSCLEGVDETLQGIEHPSQEHFTLQLRKVSVVVLVVLPHCVIEASSWVAVAQVDSTTWRTVRMVSDFTMGYSVNVTAIGRYGSLKQKEREWRK